MPNQAFHSQSRNYQVFQAWNASVLEELGSQTAQNQLFKLSFPQLGDFENLIHPRK